MTDIRDLKVEENLTFDNKIVETRVDKVLHVRKNPAPGHFSTVEDALNSITDNSITNRYLITIGPGIFSTNPLQMKEFVYIQGMGRSTILQAAVSSQDIVLAQQNTFLKDLILQGATGIGQFAVRETSQSISENPFGLFNIIFGNNYGLVSIESNGTPTETVITNASFTDNISFSVGFKFIGGTASARLKIFGLVVDIGSEVQNFIEGSGGSAELLMTEVSIIDRSGSNSSIFANLYNGSRAVFRACYCVGFNDGILTQNVGSGPDLRIQDCLFESNNLDLRIEHPNTTGFFSGVASSSRIQIDPNSEMLLSMADIFGNTKANTFLGEIRQGDSFNSLINLSRVVRQTSTVGVLTGGDLTFSGFDITVTAGTALVHGNDGIADIAWNETILTLNPSEDKYITVDSTGIVQLENFLPENLTSRVVLGYSISGTVGIVTVLTSKISAHHHGNLVEKYLREAFGASYVSGSLVAENTTTARALDIGPGKYFFGTKEFSPVGGTAIDFLVTYRDGAGGWIGTPNNTQVPVSYDNNSGTLIDIPAGEFAKGLLLGGGEGPNEIYAYIPPQETHVLLNDALASPLPLLPPGVKDARVFIASIILEGGNNNIVDIIDERPRQAQAQSEIRTVTSHSDLQNLTNDDHPQYLRTNGTRALTGDLSFGNNNITNVVSVNGVVVENHSARHLPNGQDPITTAAPTDNLSAQTVNAEGIQNSIARSDHSHSIDTGMPSTQSAGQVNAEGTSASLARADHVHNIPTGVPVSLSQSSVNSEGVSPNFARADHTHEIGTIISYGVPSTLNPDQPNTEGVSTDSARADHIHNVPAGTAVSVGSSNTEGTSTSFARADHTHNVALESNVVQQSNQVQTTSLNDVLLQGMSVTPPAGAHMLNFFTSSNNNTNDAINYFSVYVDGVQLPDTLQAVPNGSNQAADVRKTYHLTLKTTVNGSQTIEIRWRTDVGTASAWGRSISYIRVG